MLDLLRSTLAMQSMRTLTIRGRGNLPAWQLEWGAVHREHILWGGFEVISGRQRLRVRDPPHRSTRMHTDQQKAAPKADSAPLLNVVAGGWRQLAVVTTDYRLRHLRAPGVGADRVPWMRNPDHSLAWPLNLAGIYISPFLGARAWSLTESCSRIESESPPDPQSAG